jgi:hypothetical protein
LDGLRSLIFAKEKFGRIDLQWFEILRSEVSPFEARRLKRHS